MAPFITLAALASTAFAAVLDTRQVDNLGLRRDSYEDLKAVPLLPQLSAVGTYNGLVYNGWVVARPGLVSIPGLPPLTNVCLGDLFCLKALFGGLKPQTGFQVAATGIVETITQIGDLSLRPFGQLIASDSIFSFNLGSFYFGCVSNVGQSLFVPPAGCTITVTGFYSNGVQAPALRYTFTPGPTAPSPLVFAQLPPSYATPLVGLKNVTIGISEADWSPALSVLVIDDLIHFNRAI